MDNNRHTPDPEFKDKLEWQLKTQMRKEQRFFEDNGKPERRFTYLRTAALIIFSVLVGAAGLRAAQGWEQSARREILLARAELQLELAERKMELASDYIDREARTVEEGVRDETAFRMTQFQLAKLEHEALETRLDLEEIELTGQPPRTEIYAPLVGDRDFVSERLQSRLELEKARFQVGLGFLEETRERVRAGLSGSEDLLNRRMELAQVEASIDALQEQLRLRRQFLDGKVTAREIMTRESLAKTRSQVEMLRDKVSQARAELEQLRERVEAGTISRVTLEHAEFVVYELEGEYRLAQMELAFLEDQARSY